MSEYRAMLEDPATTRAIAAKALLEIGRCEEKLGQRKEAYTTYRRLVAEFGDQPATPKLASLKLAGRATCGSRKALRARRLRDGSPRRCPGTRITLRNCGAKAAGAAVARALS